MTIELPESKEKITLSQVYENKHDWNLYLKKCLNGETHIQGTSNIVSNVTPLNTPTSSPSLSSITGMVYLLLNILCRIVTFLFTNNINSTIKLVCI